MRPILTRESGVLRLSHLMKNSVIIQHLNNALVSVLSLFLGVRSILFLAGMIMLYAGLAGLWSQYGALTVCGGILVCVAVISAAGDRQKGPEA